MFNARAAADRRIAKFQKQTTLDALTEAWAEEKEARLDVRATDAAIYAEVEKSSQTRAAELRPKEQAA